MKKLLTILLLLLACIAIFCACDEGEAPPPAQPPSNTGESGHTHTLTKHAAATPTCEAAGNIEYWECTDCGKYFSDAAGTNEISDNDTVIPVNKHTWSGNAVCEACGYQSKLVYTEYDSYVEVTEIGTASGAVQISKVYNGKPVTSIGYRAFSDCTGLTSITIPLSVTSIGYSAFSGCTGLTSITIPSSVESLGVYAFASCTNLSKVTIGNSVRDIGYGAFSSCTGLTSITIPLSVTSIDEHTFYGCTGLTSITIPSSVTSIGLYAFYNCTGLTRITIPSSVTSIGASAFSGCSGLTSITVESGNTVYHSAGNCLIETASKTLITGCKNSVIPTNGSVTSIGSSAFGGIAGLTSITIPSSVTSIQRGAFSSSSELTSITVENGNTVYHSAGNCLIETASKTLILGCKNSAIPTDGSVTSIGYSAFVNCTGLTSITIPSSVTSIGDYAFAGCTDLTSITIPSSVTSIGDFVFAACSELTSITIPSSVTSIGERAFWVCTGLTSVTFENTEGWWVSFSSSDTSGTSVDVSVPSDNADLLTKIYCHYFWKRG